MDLRGLAARSSRPTIPSIILDRNSLAAVGINTLDAKANLATFINAFIELVRYHL